MNLDQKLRQAIDAHVQGRIPEAESLYREVLQKRPGDVVALHHIGVIHFHRQEFDEAAKLIRKSLTIYKNYSEAYSNLGLVLAAQGKLDEAIASYRQAIRLKAQDPDSYNNLATALLEQGKNDEAIEACRKAISFRPNFHLAHYNLGIALQRQGKLQEATESFRQAINIHPSFPEAYCNLGLACVDQGKLDEAIAMYRKAIELRPNFPEAYNNLGQPLSHQRKMEEATEAFRQAVAFNPYFVDAVNNLVTILNKRGLLAEALEVSEQGLAKNPNNIKGQIERINLRHHACDWREYDADTQRMFDLAESVEPFLLLSIPSSAAQQLECSKRWASRFRPSAPFIHSRPRQEGRIRIGYLSADFRRHATAYLMAELFECHDHSQFEVYAYSYGYDDESDVRRRLMQSFDHFIDLHQTPHYESAQKIYDDKIDILIDLKGYTGDTRTEILVNRPAPIQVNYLGYPGTLGADFIDYIIGDPFVTPLKNQHFFSEKIVQLPLCYQPNDTKRQISSHVPTRAECGLPDNGIVFCSFNGPYKITPSVFDIWMRLLKAVPESVLWLLSTGPLVESNLRREASARGVEPARLIFAKALPLPDHLARHRLADLSLDTLPINAHTTASDCLWAGLPLLTCSSESFVGRVAGSVLTSAGLPELVTTSLADYEAKALELALKPDRLADLKGRLAKNLTTSPLFDIARFTRGLEEAYRQMFDIWQAGEKPKAIVVDSK